MSVISHHAINIRHLEQMSYEPVWQQMQRFTCERDAQTVDELWVVEHPAVFTLGANGDPKHLLQASTIPLIKSDRGGQITYHGPGQLVVYVLLNLNRLGLGVKGLVHGLEETIISSLSALGVQSSTQCNAPGVYVDDAKICALGLRIRKGYSYHGLALNVNMDLTPFQMINPCGIAQAVTQLADLGQALTVNAAFDHWLPYFLDKFSYNGQ